MAGEGYQDLLSDKEVNEGVLWINQENIGKFIDALQKEKNNRTIRGIPEGWNTSYYYDLL